jgi:eukaryotic-like serine/threonine-protein kinase
MNDDTLSGLDLGPTIRGLEPGQVVFGRYKLERVLGRGGMGVVWLAHDQELNEEVALKFLPEAVRLDALALEELKRETRKSRKLTHRNIVRVYNFVSDATSAGITMEWIDGAPLSALRLTKTNRVFEVDDLKPWVASICEALDYAHDVAKLIHRDLKPANIMLSNSGEAKITDFGISSSLTESASRVSVHASASGTLAYMSPQQALGERPMPVDDIYSLGATLYEALTSKPPFFRGDLYAQIRDVVPPAMSERREELDIAGAEIPEGWEKAIAACLAKNPADRPQSAMEVAFRLGLVKDYVPKTPTVTPKPEILRVQKDEPAATAAGVPAAVNVEASKTETLTAKTQPPEPAAKPAFSPMQFVKKYPAHLVAGVLGLILVIVLLGQLNRPHVSPIAQNTMPATPTPSATPTPAPATEATPTPTPTPQPTPTPEPSAIAVIATPTPAISDTSAPIASASPSVAADAAPAGPSGAEMALQQPVSVDKDLVGRWQSGATVASRVRWDLLATGAYTVTVSGTITDSGTMSVTSGQIVAYSKFSAQPDTISYSATNGDLTTQGISPFDDVTWHKVAVSHTPHHTGSGNDSGSGGGLAHKIGSTLKKIF